MSSHTPAPARGVSLAAQVGTSPQKLKRQTMFHEQEHVKPLSRLQKLAIRIVRSGQIPQHVAIIMDGNRRFAQKHNIQKIMGHSKGFDRLSETLNWSLELGIKQVTVYAFSIENFKRTEEEVNGLMNLTKQKFQRLLDEKEKLNEYGVLIKVIGNLDLLPVDLRNLMIEAMLITEKNKKLVLNFAFSYTGREEIFQGVRRAANGVFEGVLLPSNVNQDLLSNFLYTSHSPNPDLLIRTSGETRLSDFLLWQVSCCCIFISNALWPDFSIWDFLRALLCYQHHQQDIKDVSVLETLLQS